MYPISSAVKALFDSEQHQVLRITGTDKNGTAINITDANVVMGGFGIDRYCCNGEKLEIGTAIAGQMTLKLNNTDGSFNDIVFEGTELFVEVGIADWTQENPTITYIPQGRFTAERQPRKLNQISLTCLDRMMLFDVTSPALIPWVDNNGNYITDNNGNIIYFAVELTFPMTVKSLITELANRCGVPIATDLTTLPNYNFVIESLPIVQNTVTYRTLLQWCAVLMGTCAYIDWNGELRFEWYKSVDYICNTANRFNSDLYENPITITGVTYTNTDGIEIVSGNSGYTIDLSGNYLIAGNVATLLPIIGAAVNGFSYTPFSAEVINAPYLWPLDIITFADKDGNNHSCAVTNVNFGLNSHTMLVGVGETEQTNSGTAPSGFTNQQAQLIERVSQSVEKLDDSLNQEEIFNRLTGGGEEQGVILYNGKIYINASYIGAGTVSADILKGGTLTLGGDNNVNGAMQMLDEYNNVIGEWNNNGVGIYSGGIDVSKIRGTESERVKINVDGIDANIFSISYSGKYIDRLVSCNGSLLSLIDNNENNESRITPSEILISHDDAAWLVADYFNGSPCIYIYGKVYCNTFVCNQGATGSFTTADGRTVTVTGGIITNIS